MGRSKHRIINSYVFTEKNIVNISGYRGKPPILPVTSRNISNKQVKLLRTVAAVI